MNEAALYSSASWRGDGATGIVSRRGCTHADVGTSGAMHRLVDDDGQELGAITDTPTPPDFGPLAPTVYLRREPAD